MTPQPAPTCDLLVQGDGADGVHDDALQRGAADLIAVVGVPVHRGAARRLGLLEAGHQGGQVHSPR